VQFSDSWNIKPVNVKYKKYIKLYSNVLYIEYKFQASKTNSYKQYITLLLC